MRPQELINGVESRVPIVTSDSRKSCYSLVHGFVVTVSSLSTMRDESEGSRIRSNTVTDIVSKIIFEDYG